jgi:RimK family alpha-L-glutamate ligase
MSDKKIITFTMSEKQSQFEVERLATEAEKLGIEVVKALYREIGLNFGNGTGITVRGEEINKDNTWGCWFRVAGTKSGKYVEGRNALIRDLGDEVRMINGQSYLDWPRMGKIGQHALFAKEGIPIIPTKIFYTREQIRPWLTATQYPLITKHERGYQGKSVRKFENEKEALKFVNKIEEKNLGMFLWQEYLPLKWDLRVIVLGGRVLGAMRRSAVGKEFRSNYSLGGSVEKWELSKEDEQLAVQAAKIAKLEYVGVDLMKDEEGKSYVLEVNRQCQFAGFEKATGINVAGAVVEYITR